MKLANTLDIKSLVDTNVVFNIYPYSILTDEFDRPWEKSSLDSYKKIIKRGYDVKHMLESLDKHCKTHKYPSRDNLLLWFISIYESCVRNNFPDPSRKIPVNLTIKRQQLIRKGYEFDEDVSEYASNKIKVEDIKDAIGL